MYSRRSKLEIYFAILDVVKKGTHLPTRIMYDANLSWKTLTETLDSMVEQGLLVRKADQKHHTYELTDKARTILEYFDKTLELITVK